MNHISNVNLNGNIKMRRALRRKDSPRTPILQLEHIFGFTATRNTSLTCHPLKNTLSYPSGCTTVLFNWSQSKKSKFLLATSITASHDLIQNYTTNSFNLDSSLPPTNFRLSKPSSLLPSVNFISPPKAIVSNTFSPCGRYLAVGEAGRQPRVLIWDIESEKYLVQLLGHKFGILALAFSPDTKYLVSLGYQHDGILNVWNWRSASRVASNRISSKVNSLAFSSDGSFCVTVGLRHVRFWYFNLSQHRDSNLKTQVLEGRSGILDTFKTSHFLDVACHDKLPFVYAITAEGQLCLFNYARKIKTSLDLKTKNAISLSYNQGRLVCGCSDGVTRVINASPLKLLCTLPKPHHLGVDVAKESTLYQVNPDPYAPFPDTIATRFNFDGSQIVTMFSDRSLYIWDITNLNNVQKVYSALYHSDAIWDSDWVPNNITPQLATCSSDGTIRIWNLDDPSTPDSKSNSQNNVYSNKLAKIIYVEEEGILRYQRPAILPTESLTDHSGPNRIGTDSTQGVRCVKFTPDGRYLVSGDRRGNLRVHESTTFNLITYQEAHDSEIMDVDVLTLQSDDVTSYSIASASRDRLIHVFSLAPDTFRLLQTLDDHSSSITAVCFFDHGSRLISCGADKGVIFRNSIERVGLPYYTSYHNHCGRATFYAMAPDHSNNTITAVALDKRIHQFCTLSGKLIHSIKLEEPGVDISMTRVALDASGQYACVAGTDKGIRIMDLATGHLVGAGYGHSEMITSVRFSSDCSRIITTSGDGCIYVWRILPSLALQMRSRLYKLTHALPLLNSHRSEARLVTATDPIIHSSPVRNPPTKVTHHISVPQFEANRPRASSIDIERFSSFSKSKARLDQKPVVGEVTIIGSGLTTSPESKLDSVESSFPTKPDPESLNSESSLSPSPKLSSSPVVPLPNWTYHDDLPPNPVTNTKDSSSPSPTLSERSSCSMEVNDEFLLGEDTISDSEEMKPERVLEEYLNQPISTEVSKHRRSLSSKFKAFHAIRKLPRARKGIPDSFPVLSPVPASPLPPVQRTKELSGVISPMRKSRSTMMLKQPSSPLKQELPSSPSIASPQDRVGVRPVLNVSVVRPLSSSLDIHPTYSDKDRTPLYPPTASHGPVPPLPSLSPTGDFENKLESFPLMLLPSEADHYQASTDDSIHKLQISLNSSQESTLNTNDPEYPPDQAQSMTRMRQTLQITHRLIDDLCDSYRSLGLGTTSDTNSGLRSHLKQEFDQLLTKLSHVVAPLNPHPSHSSSPSVDSTQALVEHYSEMLVQAVVDKMGRMTTSKKS